MSPTVSVVVPVYNGSTWIEETLRSIFQQTYPHSLIEVVVVDDGSQDDSASKARALLNQHDVQGQVVSLARNGGQGAARNTGWRMATGEWIQLLDADDLLAPHKLQLQTERASHVSDDVAVIYSPWQHFALHDDAWRPVGDVVVSHVDADPVAQILQDLEFGYFGPTLLRKSFLEKIGGVKEFPVLGEDIDVMLRLAMAGGAFRQADSSEPTFFYRDTPNSLWRWQVKHVESVRAHYRWLKGVEDFRRAFSPEGQMPEDVRAALVRRYSRFLEFLIEYDPSTFDEVSSWIRALGVYVPPETTPNMRRLARLMGYENGLRLRLAYRQFKARLGRGTRA